MKVTCVKSSEPSSPITYFFKFCKADEEMDCEFYEMSMHHGGKCVYVSGVSPRICTNLEAAMAEEAYIKLDEI